MYRRKLTSDRHGTVMVLTVLCLFLIMAFSALVIDIGYLRNARSELQRSADAAAMASCWELGQQFAEGQTSSDITLAVQTEAAEFAGLNRVTRKQPSLEVGTDISLGYISDFSNRNAPMDTSDPTKFNAVKVRVRRTTGMNGQIRTFFGRVMGINGLDAQAQSTAVIIRDISGFEIPADGSNLDILPFTLDLPTWNALTVNGVGSDSYSWNPDTKTVASGSDSILEVNLYPQDTGSPGNRGTVDIGGSNNSTNDIARQIVHGISSSDMQAMGGSLEFDTNGELTLNGDTGISAGVKDELASIIGQTRVIPIFSSVSGNGNNADYTIVKWVGVRILAVKLTGPKKKKHLTVQPAPISSRGIIPGSPTSGTSEYVYSNAYLLR